MATDLISTSIHVFFNISVVGAEPSCPSATDRTAAELPSSIGTTDGWSISGLVSILHGEVSNHKASTMAWTLIVERRRADENRQENPTVATAQPSVQLEGVVEYPI